MGRDARDIDIVVLGATGFTGQLIARYLSAHAPTGSRLALAGRNRAQLAKLSEELAFDFEVIEVDATDASALRDLAGSSHVLLSTVGPYIVHGREVVAACAEQGTDYLDLTGEPEFVDRTYLECHELAVDTGARLVHACGFDSIPHDLGAQFTLEQLPAGEATSIKGYVQMEGSFSGGTAASALEIMSRLRTGRDIHRQRLATEGGLRSRQVDIETGRIGRERCTGRWAIPMPTIDPQIVAYSARLDERYGPAFTYSHFLSLDGALAAAGMIGGAGLLLSAAQIPPVRRRLSRLRPPGTGPSEEKRAASWFAVRFVGQAAGQTVRTEVRGGDPGYTETSKMISEAALCLAFDELDTTAGQVTTAVAMGPVLRSRLIDEGISFKVLD